MNLIRFLVFALDGRDKDVLFPLFQYILTREIITIDEMKDFVKFDERNVISRCRR